MTKNNLLGLLFIVLFASSIALFAGCSAVYATDISYTPLADDFNPFATPSPSPSPTPEPTPTPVPTPRPEPSAKPNIDVSLKNTATASSLKVDVSGTLSYNKTAIPNASVILSYSTDAGLNWTSFSLVQTRSDGSYSAVWLPNATGNYLINAYWDGNSTLHWMNATLGLALTPDSAGNVFSVVSNSTITGLNYNAETQKLTFNTNGTTGTTGYLYVFLSKTLVSDAQSLALNIDGKPTTFNSESQDDAWRISCTYTQSTHAFTVQVPFMQVLTPDQTPTVVVIIAVVALIVVVAVVVVVRRKRRTAASVAAILKENRPTYS